MAQHYDRGLALYELGRFREAVKEFQAELGERPDCPYTYGMIAACLQNAGDRRGAEAACRQSIGLDPEHQFAHYILGLIYWGKGRIKKAEHSFREAARLEPTAEVLNCLAQILFIRRKQTECWECIGQALQLDPDHAGLKVFVSRVLDLTGETEASRRVLREALESSPDNAEVHQMLGNRALQEDTTEVALGHLLESQRLAPDSQLERASLTAAYGRLIFPLNVLAPPALAMRRWSVERRWALWMAIYALVLGIQVLARYTSPYLALIASVLLVIAGNFALLPWSLNGWGALAATIAKRRQLGLQSTDYLLIYGSVVASVVVHVTVSLLLGFAGHDLFAGWLFLSLAMLLWDPWAMFEPTPRRKSNRAKRYLHTIGLGAYTMACLFGVGLGATVVDKYPFEVWWCAAIVVGMSYIAMRISKWQMGKEGIRREEPAVVAST